MDFELSREHQALRRLVREFAEEEVRPATRQADRSSQPPLAVLKKAAEIGLLGVPFPREYGGMGAGPSYGTLPSLSVYHNGKQPILLETDGRLRYYARKLLYSWLPWRLRLRLRRDRNDGQGGNERDQH